MDVARLKQQTQPEHDRVEQTMHLMQEGLTREAYVATLQRLLGFVLGWERWASQCNGATVQALLRHRRRSDLLRADLQHFATAPLPAIYPGPALSASVEAYVLGGMYVMEGSTLGGQYIARHVEQVLALPPGTGDAFFRGYGEHTGSMWRQVKGALTALPESDEGEISLAAKAVFADFAQWNEEKFPQQQMEPTLA